MYCQVSVVIPCYRCSETILRAVNSVLQQSLPPKEIILVEDCSNDANTTLATLYTIKDNLINDIDIKIIALKENGGPAYARNEGWKYAVQPYLAFLDSDDSWHPKKLEIQYSWMKMHPDIILTGHLSNQIASEVIANDLPLNINTRSINRNSLLRSNCLPTRSVMIKRKINYRFEPSKRYAEDYLLWLQIVLSGNDAALIEVPLSYSYKADFGENGLTKNLWRMELGELDTYKRIYRDRLISFFEYFNFTVFSFIKYLRRLAIVTLHQNN